MTSPDKRMEMAARMRGPFDVCGCLGHTYISGTIYGMQVCATDELALRDGMRHLADLIDPTCEVVADEPDGGAGDFVAQMIGTVCSRCGGDMTRDRFTGAYPDYCPHCGARIVGGVRVMAKDRGRHARRRPEPPRVPWPARLAADLGFALAGFLADLGRGAEAAWDEAADALRDLTGRIG